jgi:hypothetical protein
LNTDSALPVAVQFGVRATLPPNHSIFVNQKSSNQLANRYSFLDLLLFLFVATKFPKRSRQRCLVVNKLGVVVCQTVPFRFFHYRDFDDIRQSIAA